MSLVVVGAINVDLVVAAPNLPGPGETVVGPRVERFGGGKGANAAVAASRAGTIVRLVGAVGADDVGSAALAELTDDGVDVTAVARLGDVPTGMALIVVDAAGENQIAVGAGANAALTPDHVHTALSKALASASCVLVSTEIPDGAVTAAVRAATAAGVTCILNPAPVTPAVRDLVDSGAILTPNRGELHDLTGLDDPVAAAGELTERSGAAVVVTLGGGGALLAEPGQAPRPIPAGSVDVVDTTGAGDTLNGVLAATLAGGATLDTALRRAITAASISVGAIGARGGMPHSDRIDAAVAD